MYGSAPKYGRAHTGADPARKRQYKSGVVSFPFLGKSRSVRHPAGSFHCALHPCDATKFCRGGGGGGEIYLDFARSAARISASGDPIATGFLDIESLHSGGE